MAEIQIAAPIEMNSDIFFDAVDQLSSMSLEMNDDIKQDQDSFLEDNEDERNSTMFFSPLREKDERAESLTTPGAILSLIENEVAIKLTKVPNDGPQEIFTNNEENVSAEENNCTLVEQFGENGKIDFTENQIIINDDAIKCITISVPAKLKELAEVLDTTIIESTTNEAQESVKNGIIGSSSVSKNASIIYGIIDHKVDESIPNFDDLECEHDKNTNTTNALLSSSSIGVNESVNESVKEEHTACDHSPAIMENFVSIPSIDNDQPLLGACVTPREGVASEHTSFAPSDIEGLTTMDVTNDASCFSFDAESCIAIFGDRSNFCSCVIPCGTDTDPSELNNPCDANSVCDCDSVKQSVVSNELLQACDVVTVTQPHVSFRAPCPPECEIAKHQAAEHRVSLQDSAVVNSEVLVIDDDASIERADKTYVIEGKDVEFLGVEMNAVEDQLDIDGGEPTSNNEEKSSCIDILDELKKDIAELHLEKPEPNPPKRILTPEEDAIRNKGGLLFFSS